VPLANTVLLLASATTVTMAHHGLISGQRGVVLLGFALTILLAVVFTSLQAYEYATATFTMADSVYGSAFYLATGTHGFHVLVGTAMITIAGIRFYSYQLTSEHHLGFASAIVYWHLVDVV
jgi:heme/copper-type cytochrome/quinol oxidase subunit 3